MTFDVSKVVMTFKGVEIQGYMAYDAYEQELARKREIRGKALVNLWQAAMDGLVIRHPNPSVVVRPYVKRQGDLVEIGMYMDNLPDTFVPGKIHNNFLMYAQPIGWPGYHAARTYITAVWALYLQHEAYELVTYKERGACSPRRSHQLDCVDCQGVNRVVNPHGPGEHSRMVREDCHKIEAMLKWVHADHGAKILEANREQADKELTNEVAYVTSPWD